MHSKSCSDCQDKSLEAEASDTLGGVYQLMADNETALQVCTDSLHIMTQCFLFITEMNSLTFCEMVTPPSCLCTVSHQLVSLAQHNDWTEEGIP